MDGVQIPLDAAEGRLAQDHAVQFRWGQTATPTPGVDPGHIDVLGDLHRNHRQLDDLPGAQ